MSELTPEEKQKLADESFARDFMQSDEVKKNPPKQVILVFDETDFLEEEMTEGAYDDDYQVQYLED